jgi:hypothetical protein
VRGFVETREAPQMRTPGTVKLLLPAQAGLVTRLSSPVSPVPRLRKVERIHLNSVGAGLVATSGGLPMVEL